MTEKPDDILTLAEALARLEGAMGRKNLVAHLRTVPHFAGGPTHRRNGAKYFFTAADFQRMLDSLAPPPQPSETGTGRGRRRAIPTEPSEQEIYDSLIRRLKKRDTRRRPKPKKHS